MPIIKSAIKRSKQAKLRTARNLATKRTMKNAIKEVMLHVDNGDAKKAAELLSSANSAIDTAVKKNVIHKNRGARKKSQLSKLVKNAGGSVESKPKTTAKKPAAKTTATKTTTKPAAKKAPAKKPATKKPAAKKAPVKK